MRPGPAPFVLDAREAAAAARAAELSLLRRALVACDLVAAAYRRELHLFGTVVDELDRRGVEAWMVEREDGLWLVRPGTDSFLDWLRNAAAQIPYGWGREAARRVVAQAKAQKAEAEAAAQPPAAGETGRLWAAGFLLGADVLLDWIERKGHAPTMTAAHSQGAANAAILRWSHDVGETHAIACPNVRFDRLDELPVDDLHVWNAPDDRVCGVPFRARPVGNVRLLGRIDRRGEEHRPRWYRERLLREIARLESAA